MSAVTLLMNVLLSLIACDSSSSPSQNALLSPESPTALSTVKICGTLSRASQPASVVTVTTSTWLAADVATTKSVELLSCVGECG